MPDTYKLPNHITFSDQSKYHGVNGNEGGKWEPLNDGRPPDDPHKQWMFTPGATNLQNYSIPQLGSYFQEQEPDSLLNIPNIASPDKR